MASPTQPIQPQPRDVFIEARCILNADKGHFRSLAFLFVFPMWLTLLSLPLFLQTITILSHKTFIALAFIYALFGFSLYLFSIATIIYSTQQAFTRKPLDLVTTIKSISTTFFPLSFTLLLFTVCLLSLFNILALAIYIIKINFFTVFEIDYSSNYFLWFSVFAVFFLGLFLTFCQVYCILAGTVTVVESKWGYESLRLSYYLMKRLKSYSLSSVIIHGIVIWMMLGYCWYRYSSLLSEWSSWDAIVVAMILVMEIILTVKFVVAVTVFYLTYNDLQGIEIEEGITDYEYTSLARAEDDTRRWLIWIVLLQAFFPILIFH